jgi:RNA-binding protein YhbY
MREIKKLQIGKKGLTSEFIEQIKSFFQTQTLVKVIILKSACRNKEEAKEIGEKLIESLGKQYTYTLIGYVLTVRKWRKSQR